MSEHDEGKDEHGLRIGGILMTLVLLLLLYFFSGPPVIIACARVTGDVPGPVFTFYAPVIWLYQNNACMQMILQAEIELLGGP